MVFSRRSLGRAFSPHRNSNKKCNKNVHQKISNETSSRMRVVVRLRPRNSKELESNARCVTKLTDKNNLIFDPKEKSEDFFFHGTKQNCRDFQQKERKNVNFTFDKIYGCESSNEEVFEGSTKDIVKSLLDGYNCSVFAYGATGAGKTFTMLGNDNSPGITYLTIKELYNQIAALEDEKEFELGVSHLEVYNENVQDLIKPSGPLHLREDPYYGVRVPGLSVHRISNAEELFNLMAVGNKNRTQHPTDANSESSRSHSVFQLYIRMTNKLNKEMKITKLSMIDLAGSERGSATGCKGMRFTEGSNINKSLLALGNCITSLADGLKHIPYRDSKLTRLLKDSLGGNCQTVMIANVSPSSSSYEDTYNTLKYATRAKKIKQMIKKNVVSIQMNVQQYAKLVDSMTSEIEMLRQKVKGYEAERSTLPSTSTSSVTMCTTGMELHEKELVSSLYQEQEVLAKEIFKFGEKIKILKWRSHSKRTVSDLLSYFSIDHSLINKRLKHINASIMHMESRQIGLQDKLKEAVGKYRQHCEKTKNEIEQLCKIENTELNEYIRSCKMQLEIKENRMQVEHCQQLLSMQQNQLENQDIVNKEIGSVLTNYYLTLQGYNVITNPLRTQYEELFRKVEGRKTVSWRTSGITEDKNNCKFNIKNISDLSIDTLCSDVTNFTLQTDRRPSTYTGKSTPCGMSEIEDTQSESDYMSDYTAEKRVDCLAHEESTPPTVISQYEDVDSDKKNDQYRLVTDYTDKKRISSTLVCTVTSNVCTPPKVTPQYRNFESDGGDDTESQLDQTQIISSVQSVLTCTVTSNEKCISPKKQFQHEDLEFDQRNDSAAGSSGMTQVLKMEDNPFEHCNIPSNLCIPSVQSSSDLTAESALNSTFVVHKSPGIFRQKKSIKSVTPSWQKKPRLKIPALVTGVTCNKENLGNLTFIVPKLPALRSSKPVKPGTQGQSAFFTPQRSPLQSNFQSKANPDVGKILHKKQRQSGSVHPYLPK